MNAVLRAVVAMELRRSFLSRGGIGIALAAAVPVLLLGLVQVLRPEPLAPGRFDRDYAILFQYLVLQGTLFFGCAMTFGGLVRGEILKKSLHHLLLCPVRRDLLVVGKYLAAVLGTSVLFGLSAAVAYLIPLQGHPAGTLTDHLASGGGARLASYVLVSVLGCAGYGAVFLLFGILAKSPMIPAVVFFGWEHLNFLLPAALKRFGLIHYLVSLCPIPVSEGFLAVLSEPLPWWVAVPAPLLLAALFVGLSAWWVRRMEIDYGVE